MSDEMPQNGNLKALLDSIRRIEQSQTDQGRSIGGLRDDIRQVRDDVHQVRDQVGRIDDRLARVEARPATTPVPPDAAPVDDQRRVDLRMRDKLEQRKSEIVVAFLGLLGIISTGVASVLSAAQKGGTP